MWRRRRFRSEWVSRLERLGATRGEAVTGGVATSTLTSTATPTSTPTSTARDTRRISTRRTFRGVAAHGSMTHHTAAGSRIATRLRSRSSRVARTHRRRERAMPIAGAPMRDGRTLRAVERAIFAAPVPATEIVPETFRTARDLRKIARAPAPARAIAAPRQRGLPAREAMPFRESTAAGAPLAPTAPAERPAGKVPLTPPERPAAARPRADHEGAVGLEAAGGAVADGAEHHRRFIG
jgi:hypothetical protein